MLVVIMLALVVLLAAGLAITMVHVVATSRNRVPPVFTPRSALEEVIKALDLPKRGRLVDLGCGDGRVLAGALKLRPGIVAAGVDNNPVVLMLARLRLGSRAELSGGGIMKVDLGAADRVFAYLGPELMAELEPKFERELRKGARVISQQFALPNRRADQVVELRGGRAYAKRLYVYDY